MSIIVQEDATLYSLLYSYFCKLLYMFWVVTPPIISSTHNCNYSIWHGSNFRKCSVWSQLKTRGMYPSLLPSTIAEGSRDIMRSCISTHTYLNRQIHSIIKAYITDIFNSKYLLFMGGSMSFSHAFNKYTSCSPFCILVLLMWKMSAGIPCKTVIILVRMNNQNKQQRSYAY